MKTPGKPKNPAKKPRKLPRGVHLFAVGLTQARQAASCPFDVLQALADIRRDYADHYIYLAPVGTKPHALGAIIFAAANEAISEVMFDHPVRRGGGTEGVGLIHIYDFHNFSDV